MTRQSWIRIPWKFWAMALILTMAIILVFPHASPAQSQPSLGITFPPDGTVVAPGETITVVVTPALGITFAQVIIIGEGPIGFSEVKTTAPFEFMLTIPMSIDPRSYRISASGAIGPGIGAESPAITLIVEKPGALLELLVEPTLINFEEPGQQMPLRATGIFSDGTSFEITESTQVTYVSNDPSVATVNGRGIISSVGPGKTEIIASYGTESLGVPVTVPGDPAGDATPPTDPTSLVATVTGSNQVDLSWMASTDNVGINHYEVSRSLDNATFTSMGTSFTNSFPDTTVAAGNTYFYRVQAFDAAGNASNFSNTATVSIDGIPSISLDSATLSFTGEEGGANPSTQNISITNSGGGSLNWNASITQSWLSLGLTSGSAPSTLTVSVDTTGLVAGIYTDSITLTGSGASNTPQSIPITLTITGSTSVQGTDLIMTSVSGPTTAGAGTAITIANTATNQGTEFSWQFYTGMYLSTDANITSSDTFLGHRYVTSYLQGGESSSDNTTVFIPSNLAPGTYYIGALADSSNYQTEVNENNNGLAGNIISIVPGIDLVMTSVSGPSTGGSGQSITIADTVTNEGLASTFDFYVGLFLSTDTMITTSDTFLTRRYVSGGLAGGASNSANTTLFIPSNLAPGTYYIGAIADESSNQTEGDENNNGLAGNTIIITAP